MEDKREHIENYTNDVNFNGDSADSDVNQMNIKLEDDHINAQFNQYDSINTTAKKVSPKKYQCKICSS